MEPTPTPVPPPPETGTIDLAQFQFRTPEKKICSIQLLEKFSQSAIFNEFIQFLEDINEACKGKASDVACDVSPFVQDLIEFIKKCNALIDEVPPTEQPGRFGNKAFRTWHEKLDTLIDDYLKEILPEDYHPSIVELRWYFLNSLGNTTRIDYGTGHETAFVAFLFCLRRLGLIEETDYASLALRVFLTYIDLVRKLQTVYLMEPAGSHGVWSLDDYHFLIFYFGSSQLRGHPHIRPRSALNPDIFGHYHTKYMYLDAIKHINKTKTGPFDEHSPMLHSISNVIHWDKVNGGMMKMYKGEVVGKFPVMQHFYFGSLIPWTD